MSLRPPPPLRGAMPSMITRKFDLEEGPIADDKATFFAAEIGTTQEEAGERATMLQEGEGMCMKLAPSMHTYIGRKACPVAWAGYFADEAGIMLLAELKRPNLLGHAKTAMKQMMQEAGEGGREIGNSLAQLDSHHAKRIQEWKTPEDLKPTARPRDNSVKALRDWVRGWG